MKKNQYTQGTLIVESIDLNPFSQFEKWLQEAGDLGLSEPNAMILSTCSRSGVPSSRVVLLKGLENGKFVFYTNYNSRKGQELEENPTASLTFFWPDLERQVNIVGEVTKTTSEKSNDYFQSRPRNSKLGAWASKQSMELRSRYKLITDFVILSGKYLGREVPRPAHWGGYELTPQEIQFWQGRPHRLHDRILHEWNGQGWEIKRLYP